MAIEEGANISGTVSGITNFGAFIDLEGNKTGLAHISQISDRFIKNIHDVLAIGDKVTVKVVKIGADGRIMLSMKQVRPKKDQKGSLGLCDNSGQDGGNYRHGSKDSFSKYRKQDDTFNDMLSSYLKGSKARLSTLKRQMDSKRGGRGGRRRS